MLESALALHASDVLAALLAAIAACLLGWGFLKPRRKRTRAQAQKPYLRVVSPAPSAARDAAAQLAIVMTSDYAARSLLNKGERRVFAEVSRLVADRNAGWRLMAQVSLGEILECPDREAFACVNSKRVDFLLVDEDLMPRHAIEYQGAGHHQGTSAARDAVKREALRKAGVGYHEIVAGETKPADVKRLIEKIVPPAMPSETPAANQA